MWLWTKKLWSELVHDMLNAFLLQLKLSCWKVVADGTPRACPLLLASCDRECHCAFRVSSVEVHSHWARICLESLLVCHDVLLGLLWTASVLGLLLSVPVSENQRLQSLPRIFLFEIAAPLSILGPNLDLL